LFTSVYRVQITTLTNNQRPIFYNHGDATPGCWPDFPTYLPPGTYWIESSLTSTGGTGVGVWQPPTVPNATTDNARQLNVATNTWAPIVDTGSGLGADLPFLIYGELPTGPVPGPRKLTPVATGTNQQPPTTIDPNSVDLVTGQGVYNPGSWAIDDLAREQEFLPVDQSALRQTPISSTPTALDHVFASDAAQPLSLPVPTTANVADVFQQGFALELGTL
jgi:hypothetical protein